jgi:hypothetical protein
MLPFGFSAIPILAGADSFFQSLVNEDQYLCAGHNELSAPVSGHMFMVIVDVMGSLAVTSHRGTPYPSETMSNQ